MKRIFQIFTIVILLTITVDTSNAQTTDKQQLRAATKAIFKQLDQRDMKKLKVLVDERIEVFDSTYLLRIDSWEDFEEYLVNLRAIDVLKTSIRQPSVRMIGTTGIVNFYYSQDYVIAKESPISEELTSRAVNEDPLMGELSNEVGRGTIVFTKVQNAWKAVTMHLSELPTEFMD